MTVTLSNSNSYRSLKRGICRDKYCSLYNWSILCHVQLSDQDPEYIRRLCIIPQISVHPSKKGESGSAADKGVGVVSSRPCARATKTFCVYLWTGAGDKDEGYLAAFSTMAYLEVMPNKQRALSPHRN